MSPFSGMDGAGAHPAHQPRLHLMPSSKGIKPHSAVCSWAPLSVQRKPISQKSSFQQPLSSVCFLPTAHPSNTAPFLFRASRVSMHSTLQQPRFSELTSLDIVGGFACFSETQSVCSSRCPLKSASVFWPFSLCIPYIPFHMFDLNFAEHDITLK